MAMQRVLEAANVLKDFESFSDFCVYAFRQQHLRWRSKFADPAVEEGDITSPIFLLGNQGGGLTLVSRMLRRNSLTFSVSGSSTYWTGPDEIQNSLPDLLPRELVQPMARTRSSLADVRLAPPHSWAYATTELLPHYRYTSEDYRLEAERALKAAIRWLAERHGVPLSNSRFVDKSQLFSVKLGFINSLLVDTEPQFLLITRNPYASCLRAAEGAAGDMARYAAFLTLEERFRLCVEHWRNAIEIVLHDSEAVKKFAAFRFEDILTRPATVLRKICDFTGLPFNPDMLPSEGQSLPPGTRYPQRWYPLRSDVNEPYLNRMDSAKLRLVEAQCGELADHFGYRPPNRL